MQLIMDGGNAKQLLVIDWLLREAAAYGVRIGIAVA